MLLQTETTLTLESIDKYRSSLLGNGLSEDTAKAYTTDLRMFLLEICGEDTPPAKREILPTEYEESAKNWLNITRKVQAPKTIGRRLTSLRQFARWAGMGEVLVDYKAPTPAPAEPHPLPEGIEGVRRLIELARSESRICLIALCGLMGLRISEARLTRPSDFDLQSKLLLVHGKGDKERIVPISPEAWEYLCGPYLRNLDGDQPLVKMDDRYARRSITALGRKACFQRSISSHDLRATFATAVYDKTHDIVLVQRLLGHASPTTTQVYVGRRMDQMREAVILS